MPRWQPDPKSRLREAALALYEKRGFDAVTVEEIAERAGLTKRTFFRHFADKREVLFGGSENVTDVVASAVRSAPKSAGPLAAVEAGLLAWVDLLDDQGELAKRRIRIVRASPELWERQLIKFAAMAAAIAEALRQRGVGETAALLAAESGITAGRLAADHWVNRATAKSLRRLLAETLAELREIASTPRTVRARVAMQRPRRRILGR